MSTTEMYYGEPGGQMHGPLEWDAIRAAVHAGRLTKTVQVSRDGQEPWVPFTRVENFGLAAFPAAHPTRAEVDARAKEIMPASAPEGVGEYIKLIGQIFLIATVLCIFAAIVQITKDGKFVVLSVYCGLTTLVSGLLFLACAEALERLAEIVRLMRK